MSDEKLLAAAERTPAAPPAEAPTPKGGWVVSADGRYHEVEDIAATLAAYPGVYSEAKKADVVKTKVGWAESED